MNFTPARKDTSKLFPPQSYFQDIDISTKMSLNKADELDASGLIT